MPFPRISTRTGDQGETSLWSGERVPKTDSRIKAIGALDLALAALGRGHGFLDTGDPFHGELRELFLHIHRRCIHLMGEVACSPLKLEAFRQSKSPLNDEDVRRLDERIESLRKMIDRDQPTPFEWKLYGQGGPAAAEFYFIRGLFREAEIKLCDVAESGFVLRHPIRAFLNRLSDLLFLVAIYLERPAVCPDKASPA